MTADAHGYHARMLAYAQRITRGEEVAGKFERLMCERLLRDIERQDTDAFPYVLDIAAGTRACAFQELLPHIKGEWAKPIYVDGEFTRRKIKLEDWQIAIEFQLFGWRHRETGLRRFRRSYEEIARKNAKSTRAAARALYMLTADGEPGSHVYSAATTGEQAREVFDVARNMALFEPEFRARFAVDVGKHDITIAATASSFKPLNSEGSTLDGLNVQCAIIDEVHAHKKRDVYDVIDTATGARAQPMVCAITTAGSDRAGICYELRGYTIQVLEGYPDENWFGVIFTIDDGDVWHDPACWRKANPNLGISVKQDQLEAACKKALAQPSAVGGFLTKHLNVWVNADSAWMDMIAWEACKNTDLSVQDFLGEPAYIGLDLAERKDIAAKIKLFEREGIVYAFGDYWLPQRAVDIAGNSQYEGWARSNLLHVSAGEVTDFREIEDNLRADAELHQIQEVAFDPWHARQLAGHMVEEGMPMVEVPPSLKHLSEPMKRLEELVLTGRFKHNGDPILTWMVSNVVAHRDSNDNIRPNKERIEKKIDGVIALLMALNRLMVNIDSRESVYESRGVVAA